MSENETKPKQGKPWKTVGVYNSYENASNMIMHLIAADPTYNYKIKRCGPLGSQFAIKCRVDPKLAEAERLLNKKSETLAANKAVSKNKKNKKK